MNNLESISKTLSSYGVVTENKGTHLITDCGYIVKGLSDADAFLIAYYPSQWRLNNL